LSDSTAGTRNTFVITGLNADDSNQKKNGNFSRTMYIALLLCWCFLATIFSHVDSFRASVPFKKFRSRSLILQAKRPWDVLGRLDILEGNIQEIKDGMKNMQSNFIISQIPIYGGFCIMIYMMMNK